jgi:energy-coupling factor transport system permease protein
MMLLEPLTPDPGAPLAHAHPLAKLGAAAIVMAALFVTVDAVTPAITLVGVLGALLLIGVPRRPLARRAFPLFIAAAGIAFFNGLVSGDAATGIALGIRLVGISLAGIVAVATVDPTELADALVEHLNAPPRFSVGALAAFRLMPLFADEWQTIALARRARGLEDARRVSAFVAMTRSLLVAAIRRATRLAIAMDARGFADTGCRTLARPRAFARRDWALLAASVAVALIASLVSVMLGTWRFLLSV